MRTLLSAIEWLVIVAFVGAGISMYFVDPVVSGSKIVTLLGSSIAAYIYSVVFFAGGAVLVTGKVLNKINLRKAGLLAAYLIAVFVFLLEILLLGWTWFVLDELILGLLAGWAHTHLNVWGNSKPYIRRRNARDSRIRYEARPA